jgi:hypothetical protein
VDETGDVMLDLTGVGADLEPVETEGQVIALEMERPAPESIASRLAQLSAEEAEEVERALSGALALLQKVSDILDEQSDREAPAVSGLMASVRSLRDARITQGKG